MIKILFMGAEPRDAVRLNLGKEAREIREKLQLARERDKFDLNERWAVRPVDIVQHMLDVEPGIVHFSGHGAGESGLCFEGATGNTQFVTAAALKSLFAQFSDTIKCVVLNACYAEEQAKAIVEQIDFVVGMNDKVNVGAAIAFSVGFYQGLGAGRTVQKAFELGKVQILLQGVPDVDVPVLLVKPGVDVNSPLLLPSPAPQNVPATAVPIPFTVNRTPLIRVLDDLEPSDLTRVIALIEGAARRDRPLLTTGERMASLIGYAESSVGPGLQAVAEAVVQLFPNELERLRSSR